MSAISIAIGLYRCVIPRLRRAITIATCLAVELSATMLLATIMMGLETEATEAYTVLPRIIALTYLEISMRAYGAVSQRSCFLDPSVGYLVVLAMSKEVGPILFGARRLYRGLP